MANAIIASIYNKYISKQHIDRIRIACSNVLPDNLEEEKPVINVTHNVAIGLTYSNEAIKQTDNGLLLGNVFKEYNNTWDAPSTTPDGSFGIFRWDNNYIELLSDIVSTRTIWYYTDESFFVASTSQRMIITFLGNYEPNIDVFPWMMSTGSLGPFMSWDARINFLPPDSKLFYNRKNLELKIDSNRCNFKEKKANKKEHKTQLSISLQDAFDQISYDLNAHYTALSGGYDSRGILLYLSNKKNLNTITWGEPGGESAKLSDASVARRLARHYKTNHYYLEIDNQEQSEEVVLERFLKNGEGRIDNLSGYIDGFELWKQLKHYGVESLIRGDENFGMIEVSDSQNVMEITGLSTLSDYQNLPGWFKRIYREQQIPEYLRQKNGETLEQWRDRLHQEYRTPVFLAALTTLKSNYIEITNPLLSKLIINEVRTLPDNLRNNKSLFKKVVDSKSPNIPYANKASTISLTQYLKRSSVVSIFKSKFQENNGEHVPIEVTDFLLNNIKEEQVEQNSTLIKGFVKTKIKEYMPRAMKNILKKNMKKNIDYNLLAFRVYIILRMQEILEEDANKVNDLKW